MTQNRWLGLVLLALGAWFARWTYTGLKDGNTTMSALVPAYREKQPAMFWLFACLRAGWAALGLIAGAVNLGAG